jgi:hypothetical protein
MYNIIWHINVVYETVVHCCLLPPLLMCVEHRVYICSPWDTSGTSHARAAAPPRCVHRHCHSRSSLSVALEVTLKVAMEGGSVSIFASSLSSGGRWLYGGVIDSPIHGGGHKFGTSLGGSTSPSRMYASRLCGTHRRRILSVLGGYGAPPTTI